jgi:hypothetical protein
VTHHILACTEFCAPASGGPGVIGWLGAGFIVLCCVIGLIRYILGQFGVKAVRNDPVTPPWLREVATGQRTPAYRSPVRAVTPSGVLVTYRACCPQGHQVPEQAVRHAQAIAWRISRTGR